MLSFTRMSHAGLLIAAVLLAGFCQAAPRAAAQAAAAPTPGCDPVLFTDPEGDQRVNVVPISGGPASFETPAPAKPNVDIRSGWINHTVDAAGVHTVTANIQVSNLTKEYEEGATSLIYNFEWKDAENVTHYAQANVSDAETLYSYGTAGADGYTEEDTTKGALYEGAMGVVSIVLPKAIAPEGKTLLATSASAANNYGFFFPQNDGAGGTKNYKVQTPCSTPASGGGSTGGGSTGGGSTGGGSTGGGSTSGGSGSGSTGGTSQPPVQQAFPFSATVTPTSFKAKKVKTAKSIAFTVDARETLRNVKFSFKKGSKLLAAVAKATFTKGKVTLELKKRGLNKGTYKFVISGIRANNAAATQSYLIKIK